jgi:mannan endo-1,4-beta-mannosidase
MRKKNVIILSFTSILITCFFSLSFAIEPVTPNASPEAKALLELFYRISGKYTLTGQHNYPNTRDRNTRFAAEYIGQTPAIWSTDMGFAKDGDTDSYLARPDIVKEAIRQHKKGAIVTLCWHAVPPTANEPVTFRPVSDKPVHPDSLNTIQGRLSEWQYKELMTQGTALHDQWKKQVDSIAVYLKKLQEAKVPVLWRPYHEMNGDWFWWGERVGEYSTIDLWIMLYDRLVNHHQLENLIWVWNVDRPGTPIRKFSNFYPGDKYLDIVSLDVYGSDFKQAYYDSLMGLAKGKPLYFGEVGNPPVMDVYKTQPNWTGWVIWAGMVRNTSKKEFQAMVNDRRMLFQEDKAYWEVMNPYRKACGLPLLPIKNEMVVDFTGTWKFSHEKSELGSAGAGNVAETIDIDHDPDLLHIKKTMLVEWGDDKITQEDLPLDGSALKVVVYNTPTTITSQFDEENRFLRINSRATYNRGGQPIEIVSNEIWMLKDDGKLLVIDQRSKGFRGEERNLVLVYEKE